MSPRKKPCSLVEQWKKSNKLFRGVVLLCLGHALGRLARWWAPSSATLGHAPTHSRPPCVGGVGGRAGDRRRPTAATAGRRRQFSGDFSGVACRARLCLPDSPKAMVVLGLVPRVASDLKGGALAVFDAACCCRERRGCGLMLARAAFTIFPPW